MEEQFIQQVFTQACLNTIQATVSSVLAKSQERCPVETGQLRASAAITEANPSTGQYILAYNANDSAPYAAIVEKGGVVGAHYRRSPRTGQSYPVKGYTVEGKFFLRDAITDVLSGDFNDVVITANQGSTGYSINYQKEDKMEDLEITQNQEWIIAKHSRMVGKVLDLVEAAMPEGKQCEKLKKLLQVPLYDFRNDMLRLENGEADTNIVE